MKLKNILPLCLLSLFFATTFSSCKEDELSKQSVFSKEEFSRLEQSEFDKWLFANFVKPYNIQFIYRVDNTELDLSKNLVPTELHKSELFAKMTRSIWCASYDEAAGEDFLPKYAPKIIQLIGSAAYNTDGTTTLGTAEGGLKVTLYLGNNMRENMSLKDLNSTYFKTLHHEFAHILHQTYNYPVEYDLISSDDYLPTSWFNRRGTHHAKLGFITAYAGSQPREDIAEITACYLTFTDADWKRLWKEAGVEGKKKIEKKIELVKHYMKESFGVDMDELKAIITRNANAANAALTPDNPNAKMIDEDYYQLIENCHSILNCNDKVNCVHYN